MASSLPVVMDAEQLSLESLCISIRYLPSLSLLVAVIGSNKPVLTFLLFCNIDILLLFIEYATSAAHTKTYTEMKNT